MARHPDARWRLTPDLFARAAARQARLLGAAAPLARKGGGLLIYATCSLEPEENWEVVRAFQVRHPDFRLDPAGNYIDRRLVSPQGCLASYPHIHGIDGVFGARLVRKNI